MSISSIQWRGMGDTMGGSEARRCESPDWVPVNWSGRRRVLFLFLAYMFLDTGASRSHCAPCQMAYNHQFQFYSA